MYRTVMFGSKILSGEIFENNKFLYNSDLYIDDLNKNMELVNFSMRKLSIDKAIRYATKALDYDSNYNEAIIELGEYDILKYLMNKDCQADFFLKNFKRGLESFIDLFKEKKIKIVLVGLTDISGNTSMKDYLMAKYNFANELNTEEFSELVLELNKVTFEASAKKNVKFIYPSNVISSKFDEYLCSDKVTLSKNAQTEVWIAAKKLV